MAKVREIAVYRKEPERQSGKFEDLRPLEERLMYAAELYEEGNQPRRVFGKTLARLAKNIALNMESGDEFRLSKKQTNGQGTFAVEDSEVKALEHAISHHLGQRNFGK